MKWIIQNSFFSEYGYRAFVAAIQRLGLDHDFVSVTSTGELLTAVGAPLEIPHGSAVFPMGSYSLARIGLTQGWRPGAFLEGLDYPSWSTGWGGDRLLNPQGRVVSLAEADFDDEAAFIRPVADTKAFSGKVFEQGEWRGWKRRLLAERSSERLGPDTLVVIAKPRTLFSETRCWVVDGSIVSSSGYRRGRDVLYTEGADPEVLEFARACIGLWTPNRAFVLDIAQTPDGCRVVEANCLNSAGFYACDVMRLAIALEDAFGIGSCSPSAPTGTTA